MISIELLLEKHTEGLNDFISLNPNSLIYANSKYISLISEHLDAESSWLIAKRGNDIVGALPFSIKQGSSGFVYNSLPYYGSNGGVIQNVVDKEVKFNLIEEYYELAKRSSAACATIITNPLEKDYEIYKKIIKYNFKDSRIGQITSFNQVSSEEDLINSFQNPRPRNIRRAIKEGVQVEKSQSKWAIDFLYKIHKKEMESKGGLAKKREFFDLIPLHLNQNQWTIYIAKLNQKPIAALLLLYFNKTVEYYTPAIIYEYRNTQASTLIIYRAMLEAINSGYLKWNWGGTWTSQEGVYNYKKKWNAMDYPYYYFIKLFNEDLLNKTPENLQKEYYGFYTIPYSELITTGE
jgi:hypothetical protein